MNTDIKDLTDRIWKLERDVAVLKKLGITPKEKSSDKERYEKSWDHKVK